ncbi:MAG: ABC-F family ATP-binding cassette domain-containing protein [Flavobacteriales bacterium]|nr:ABC-F family ATP-binding cassette domain-containing protein [Flavobacteriales bacterium]
MFSALNLGLAYGGVFLFREVNFQIRAGEKVALTGRNGAGKSSLFRIMTGEISPTEGQFSAPRGARIARLGQELPRENQYSAREHAARAFEETRFLKNRVEQIYQVLEKPVQLGMEETLSLTEELHELEERLRLLDAQTEEERTERLLTGLGFSEEIARQPLGSLSGGWQMRAELARLLLSLPDLLLLDEPTNHLDIESIMWLEDFMKTTPSAILLISHDREFLDNTTARTLEISGGKLYDYPFAYSRFVAARAERRATLEAARRNQEKERERLQQNIDRFRYKATKAWFAQSLIKKLERMETIEDEDDEAPSIHFRFPNGQPSGKTVVRGENVSKTYDGRRIFGPIEFCIARGDRIALIGRNGMGKTTLARMLAGQIQGEGRLEIGHNVRIGFYSQDVASTHNPHNTVLREMEETAAPYDTFPMVRSILGAFLFSGDSVYKKTSVLSGGEKSRLALAKLLVQPFNFLILDEPTNHLDMASKAILKNALQHFAGTVVVVSHDRDFLKGLCTHTWEFASDGIHMHLEGVESVLEKRQRDSLREYAAPATPSSKRSENSPATAEIRLSKEHSKELKKLRQELDAWERKIEALEKEQKNLETLLADPAAYLNQGAQVFDRYEAVKKSLQEAWNAWTELSENVAARESLNENIQ